MRKYLSALFLVVLSASIAGAQTNPSPVQWTSGASAPAPFARAGSAVLGNYFYCFGGDASNPTQAQAYDLLNGGWVASTPPHNGGVGFSCVATNDAIYLICRLDSGTIGTEVQKFTPIGDGPTGIWTDVAPYPVSTFQIAAAWDGGNYIYAAGGIYGFLETKRYNITGNVWEPLANLPMWRNAAGGAYVGNKFYVIGGWPVNSPTLEYNPANNSWTQKGYMPVWVPLITWNTTSVYNGSLVYVVGGGGFTGSPPAPATNLVQVFDPATGRWEVETPLPGAQGWNSARLYSLNKIISAGGGSTAAPSTVTYLGTSFPNSSPLRGVTATLTPTGSTSLGGNGGKIKYSLQYHNGGTGPVTVDVWLMVTMTDGSQTGPYLTVLNRSMAAGATLTESGMVTVPRSWAGGTYYLDGYVGDYNPPNNVLYTADHFSFTKAGAAPGPVDPAVELSSLGHGQDIASSAGVQFLGATPNPFRGATDIRFALPQSKDVELRIYNAGGQLVATLVNGRLGAGEHAVSFGGRDLPSGIYFAALRVDGQLITRSAVLSR